MSNPYESGKGDPKNLEDALLGPHSYSYYDKIKAPAQMGMSSDGSIDALTNDVAGLIAYVDILAFGNSEASTSGGPLGNKYFLQTSAKCFDKNDKEQNRYIYINNIPDGKFKLLPNNTGMTLTNTNYEGLIPGIMEDISRMNPMQLFQSFVTGSKPKCSKVTLPVGSAGDPGINPPNCKIPSACESHYLLNTEINGMNDAWFSSDHPKPTNLEGFDNWKPIEDTKLNYEKMPNDPIIKLWYTALGILGLYLFTKLSMRK